MFSARSKCLAFWLDREMVIEDGSPPASFPISSVVPKVKPGRGGVWMSCALVQDGLLELDGWGAVKRPYYRGRSGRLKLKRHNLWSPERERLGYFEYVLYQARTPEADEDCWVLWPLRASANLRLEPGKVIAVLPLGPRRRRLFRHMCALSQLVPDFWFTSAVGCAVSSPLDILLSPMMHTH